MKQSLFAGILLPLLSFTAFAQTNINYRFVPANGGVIAYKQGNSCTAGSYSFFMVSGAGKQVGTPFYTLANTSREVNGIGINPVDFFLYAVEYNRDATCGFSNFHLVRYDAQGNFDDLGRLPAINGGNLTAALGCVTNNGNFIYSTQDAAGNAYVSMIADVASLPAEESCTLTMASSKQIINNSNNFTFSDWAVHPTNGKIYTYGIANIGGVSTGSVLELNPATGILQSVGQPDGTSFSDPVHDNFGGVYFGSDGLLYGVNTNTRNLYTISVRTGVTSFLSTIAGTGQISADMGSYATGPVTLPTMFEKTAIVQKGEQAILNWKVSSVQDIKSFVVEKSTGEGTAFTEVHTLLLTEKERSETNFVLTVSNGNAQYRVKAIGKDGKVVYSAVVYNKSQSISAAQLLNNPVRDKMLRFLPAETSAKNYSIINPAGQTFKYGTVNCTKNNIATIALNNVTAGVYLFQLGDGQKTTLKFIVE
ncbi:MAG TPA: T9SS type A sorting domain-containing protein [Flavisolibacter sp.]|nr:T9SS type A sorting domain-containing protein [Flavisolibacter sp.]